MASALPFISTLHQRRLGMPCQLPRPTMEPIRTHLGMGSANTVTRRPDT